jgi:periplasmic copper chaperone A
MVHPMMVVGWVTEVPKRTTNSGSVRELVLFTERRREMHVPNAANSSFPNRPWRCLTLLGITLSSLGLAVPSAQAHVEPSPSVVKAGAKTSVSFNIEHGCGASPTMKLQVKIPNGVTVSHPRGPSATVASISGAVVTFDGEIQGKNQKIVLTLQFPKTPGLLRFPVVQTCKTGKESWIEVPNSANPKPNFPAPTIRVK